MRYDDWRDRNGLMCRLDENERSYRQLERDIQESKIAYRIATKNPRYLRTKQQFKDWEDGIDN